MSEYIVSVNGNRTNIKVTNGNELFVDDVRYNYEIIQLNEHTYIFNFYNRVYELAVDKNNSELFSIILSDRQFDVTVRTILQEKAIRLLENSVAVHHQHRDIKAPMPGLILKVRKNAGDKVEQGESIMILEAMKMENDLKSPVSGTIEKVFVKEGSAVEKGIVLFSIC